MAWRRIRDVLKDRADQSAVLREAAQRRDFQNVWENDGAALFPKRVREHLSRRVRVLSAARGVVVVRAPDHASAAALVMKRRALIRLFQKHFGSRNICDVVIRQG